MAKTNIKIIIFALFVLFGINIFARQAFAGQITVENVINLVNLEREKAGLAPLLENPELSKAAEDKSGDMLANNYFAHTSPAGIAPWHWFEKNGYGYKFAGENLAINFSSAEKQNEAFMESPTHRKNILGEQFNEIGVAVRQGIINGKQTTITVQEFGNRGVVLAADNEKPVAKESGAKQKSELAKNDNPVLIGLSVAENVKNFAKKYEKTFFLLAYAWVILFVFFVVGRISKLDLASRIKNFQEHFWRGEKEGLGSGKVVHLPIVIIKENGIYLHHMKQKE